MPIIIIIIERNLFKKMENQRELVENKNYVLDKITNLYAGKYFRIATKKYYLENDSNKNIEWECVYRTDLADFKKIYGAEIIGLIKNSEEDCKIENFSILLIENYRYPVDKKILEFPSGMIENLEYRELEELHNKIHSNSDEEEKNRLNNNFHQIMNEITINSASRELKEETGYSGTFKSFFSLPNRNSLKLFENIFYDPWKGMENAAFCMFEIDKSAEDNLFPKQNLDECEVIKVHEVKLSELLNFITDKIENENYGCSSHVYSFAMGMQFSNLLTSIYKR